MRNREFWFFLFFVGLMLLNWPFLDIFNMVLPLYFLGVWSLFILLVGVMVSLGGQKKGGRDV